jgi:ABC-2 type transport system permease protein
MVADSGSGLGWLRWATPLGWIEELRPLASPRPLAFLPIAALIALLAGAATHLAGRRDLGASTVADRPPSGPRTTLLSGPTGLALRLARPVLIGWMIAIVLIGLMMGAISKTAGRALAESPSFKQFLTLLGSPHAGAVAYLGAAFLIIALLVALIAAGQVSAARDEEATDRLDNLLVRPVSRVSWLGGRLAVAAIAAGLSGFVAGLATWIGAASQHAGVGLVGLLGAGANAASPALFLLGIGALVFGLRPRMATVVVYAVLAWSFLVEIIGGIIKANHWLLDTSLFYQMAAAPAVNPHWSTDGVFVGLGVAAAAVGAALFRRRDLVGD